MRYIKCFLLLIVLFPCYVSAIELCDMSDEYKKWLELPDEERNYFIEPAYCQSDYHNRTTLESITSSRYSGYINVDTKTEEKLKVSISEKYYNSVDLGYITSVKNQMQTGSCWAFSSNSLIETGAIMDGLGVYDLSERHVEYSTSRYAFTDKTVATTYNRQIGSGANPSVANSYYANHDGPVMESSMPFVNDENKVSSTTVQGKKALLDVDYYMNKYYTKGSCTSSQISEIKTDLLKYGSVGVSFYSEQSYLKNSKYYLYGGGYGSNHQVVLVGWDDSVSGSLFDSSNTVNGAFIAKNSWGTGWGDNGYFYISYADVNVCSNIYVYDNITLNNYDNVYNYSNIGKSALLTYSSSVYNSVTFTKKTTTTETLDKVSFDVKEGTQYKVYYTSSDKSVKTSWTQLGSGTAAEDSIVSVRFSPITVASKYSIIIEYLNSPSVPLMCNVTTSSSSMFYNMPITSGVAYYSYNGTSWTDLASQSNGSFLGCMPIIYAYTKNSTTVSPSFNVTGISATASKVYTNSSDYFTIGVTSSNIQSYELFGIIIKNSNGAIVTSKFDVENKIQNGSIIIKMNSSSVAGTYTVNVSYGADVKTINFTVYANLESNTYEIKDGNIYARFGTLNTLTRSVFFGNLNTFGITPKILDVNDVDITNNIDEYPNIGTGMKIVLGDFTYNIVLYGDVSGDGKVLSNDALIISKYIVCLRTLDDLFLEAADVTGDGKVLSNDALRISRFLVGLRNDL